MSSESDLKACPKCGQYRPLVADGSMCIDCKMNSKLEVEVHVNKDEILKAEQTERENVFLKAKLDAYNRFADERFLMVKTPEEFRELFEQVVREAQQQIKQDKRKSRGETDYESEAYPQTVKGSAPLPSNYDSSGRPIEPRGFESYEAMLKYYREKEKHGSEEEKREAKRILDALFRKFASQVRRDKKLPDVSSVHENMKEGEQ